MAVENTGDVGRIGDSVCLEKGANVTAYLRGMIAVVNDRFEGDDLLTTYECSAKSTDEFFRLSTEHAARNDFNAT